MRVVLRQLEQEAQALSNMLDLPTPDNQQLIFEITPDIEIAGSSSEILSAMSNLISNAIRYTPSDGCIHVRLRLRDEGHVEFSVQDTGPGIAPEHIPRLTERFYRVDRSRSRDTGGTGLGLAIVKHVAQRHGAELKIDSTTGHGSTFSIIFSPERVRIRPMAAVLPEMTVIP
jgi:two-component system phosphate regulon sensor histidine kinase PhoR